MLESIRNALGNAHVRLTVLMRHHSEKVQSEALGELEAAMDAIDNSEPLMWMLCDKNGPCTWFTARWFKPLADAGKMELEKLDKHFPENAPHVFKGMHLTD